MNALLRWLVRGYRKAISPLLGPAKCRFEPSCSAYALVALERHGTLRGLALAVWRLLRCQPLCKGGYDPVPLPKPDSATDANDESTRPTDTP